MQMQFFLSLFFSILFSFEPASIHAQNLPLIQVQANQFVLPDGSPVIFSGLNTSDPDRLEKAGQWSERYFQEMKNWGVNLVRFPIHPKAWRERGVENYLALLDKGISWASEQEMYVVLDWHSIGNLKDEMFQRDIYNTTKIETKAFWKLMAQRYGKNSSVALFELFNEPTVRSGEYGSCTWPEWKNLMEELINIIRAEDAQNIPLVAGFNWAYDLTEVVNDPIDATGIAYVSHPYPQKRAKPWHPAWEKDFGHVADQYPLVLTEIGYCGPKAKGAHRPVISDESYVSEILDYCDQKDISYCIWVFDPSWSPMLLKNWRYKLTKPGKVWKKALLKK